MFSSFASVSYEIPCQLLLILEEQIRTTQVGSPQTAPTQKQRTFPELLDLLVLQARLAMIALTE